MFDVGFTELLLIFVIGLLILGPERLPRVAAQIGRWVARARRTANQLRMQLEREVALEEIKLAQQKSKRKTGGAPGSADDAAGPGAEGVSAAGTAAGAPGGTDPDGSPADGGTPADDREPGGTSRRDDAGSGAAPASGAAPRGATADSAGASPGGAEPPAAGAASDEGSGEQQRAEADRSIVG